jgi:hypothetical protein
LNVFNKVLRVDFAVMRFSVFIARVNLLSDDVDKSVFKLRELFPLYSKRLCFTFFEYQEVRSHF